jgi:Ca2+-binding RTX toxin-like protein
MVFQLDSLFSINADDLKFLRRQVNAANLKIVRYDIIGQPIYGYVDINNVVRELGLLGTFDPLDSSIYINAPIRVRSVLDPLGTRTIDGVFNNLNPGRFTWGSTNELFPNLTKTNYSNIVGQNFYNLAFNPGRFGPNTIGFQDFFQTAANGQTIIDGIANSSALYANPFKTVVDYTPRMISQTVSSQTALNRLNISTDIDNSLGNSTPFIRSQRTDTGNQSQSGFSGMFVLFGQYLDHGLDFIEKGGNIGADGKSAKIVIPLSPTDPLYDPARGVTSMTISRANVSNPLGAGPDGKFRTADDIDPGADGKYGTADDVIGPVNSIYLNRTSPYTDLSQAYGSDQQITQLLREWVEDPNNSGRYIAGANLFSGNSLKKSWNFVQADGTSAMTKETVPTLKELRAHLRATGRDDLTWEDIQNYRVRDDRGRVLDADPNRAGIQVIKTGQAILLDMNPLFDASRIYQNGKTKDTTGILAGVELSTALDSTGLPTTITVNGTAYSFSKFINPTSFSIQSNLNAAERAIANELLLRSVGNHYVAGDGRLNENFGLTTIHHIFHKNHDFHLNSLQSKILMQQSQDPTQTYAHHWQVAVKARAGVQLAEGVRIVNNRYEDALGNYVKANGSISWNQDKLFEAARFVNHTEYQHIVFEYARFVSPDIPKFDTYNPEINADISLEYAQAAFRYGHSQLRETIDYLDPNGSLTADVQHFALKAAFLNPGGFAEVGPGAIALGMARQVGNEIDEFVTPALQQTLLGQPLDLAAINIARGRDLGLPTLNEARKQMRDALVAERASGSKLHRSLSVDALKPYVSWKDFGNNMIHPESLVNFIAAYSFDGDLAKAQAIVGLNKGTILQGTSAARGFTKLQANNFLNGGDRGFEKIDLWLGGLAEKHVSGGILGTTFNTIFADQLERLQNGDRLYYLFRIDSEFQEARGLLTEIESEDFKDIVERNTGARHLQGDVFEHADNHIELGEIAVSNPKTEHKYGGLAAVKQQRLGVFSTSGISTSSNGAIVTINGQQYVLDARPDSSSNASGKPAKGFNSDEVIGGTDNNDYINAGGGSNTVYGEGGNDILKGGSKAEFFYGGKGNDTIKGGDGADLLNGATGNDYLFGDNGADLIIGGDGNDVIYGGNGDDDIFAGAGNDHINAGSGSNKVLGGDGYDTVYKSGSHLDYIISSEKQGKWTIKERIGNGDTDTLIEIERIQFATGGIYSVLNGTDGNDTLNGTTNNEYINGDAGNDKLYGQAGNDTLDGGVGNDTLDGGVGNDTLIDSKGNDVMVGGAGRDLFVFSKDSSLQASTIEKTPVLDALGRPIRPIGSFLQEKVSNVDLIQDFNVNQDVIELNFGIQPNIVYDKFEYLMTLGNKAAFFQLGADTYIGAKNLGEGLGDLNGANSEAYIVLKNVNIDDLGEANFIFGNKVPTT